MNVPSAVQTFMVLAQSITHPRTFGSRVSTLRIDKGNLPPVGGTGEASAGAPYDSDDASRTSPRNALALSR